MRVLMFGWEFPPFQASGLATATDVPNLRLVSAAIPRAGLRSIRIEFPLLPYGGPAEYLVLAERSSPSPTGGTV